MTETYLDGVQVLFDGEVMGERLMLALHAVAKSPRDAGHFAAILQLETETKARLRALLFKHGRSLAEAADLAVIPTRIEDYLGQDWQGYTGATAARLAHVVGRYKAIAALGPVEDQPILQAVVDHEQALVDWASLESQGQDGVGAIQKLLQIPIAPL